VYCPVGMGDGRRAPARRFIVAVQPVRVEIDAVRPGDRPGDRIDRQLSEEGWLAKRFGHEAFIIHSGNPVGTES